MCSRLLFPTNYNELWLFINNGIECHSIAIMIVVIHGHQLKCDVLQCVYHETTKK